MKRSDKIAGVIVLIALAYTIFYIFKNRLIYVADNRSLYIVGIIFVVGCFATILDYLIIGFILKKRVLDFKRIASKYSLKHSFVKKLVFIPYGKLNMINGNLNNHDIEISDEHFIPQMIGVIVASITKVVPKKSINMDTKIYVDGKNVTPEYSQKWIIYRNPFMKVSEIESFLKKL